jgi:hypothetical protein
VKQSLAGQSLATFTNGDIDTPINFVYTDDYEK